ncbi:hypothetical protein RUM44_002226 [Polyplax serrata]|uniref:Acetyl-CoA hydrolase/transferase C-terminal domain-containing protein n=1 Tax=Polyplax serrata TaxID=468196 RepID=A0ABR1AMA2_POLSC
MLEVDYTNSTFVISQMPKMTAINSCIEVDLTGQVCSDSIGTRMYSGFGGQVDFIRGAAEAKDGKGKPILAFPSSTKGISKIAPYLKEGEHHKLLVIWSYFRLGTVFNCFTVLGAGVVTSRAHVGYLVTEYGIADLFGKTLRQRAYALIQIAHPDHREALERAAFQRLKTMPVK